ncbi:MULTISPECIES: bifunctional metallophosphatase/5'-nucleotidase [Devosia]|uniref:Trifunctional nucleotide phosphoesterase protein YfkN n=1 Tax=Devosia equisanguinis TaxID=2490941 RepID=A0A3S4GIW2_9HYPH|nr:MULTISPECIES: bifunctional metallophosphatase/5'-nucleotidase [Devosia]ODT49702.1 MAG: multifunctional 2',3'-cyclic-nucleotide 2'-phosphodiesterase/5'-nucleotidase/3'-nucleotidase [Pelagibacterium sp. SCN 63-126]ODU87714.1 MAG: multifunctional 2',3'-cyclic-nucleotide 2'-phosphodiesterase/5'-nucleotidase/3'-nucleotidase [Pelagibacterium sp. SCN 63-17]OJX45716.1 MAG: multifunctional 2',3'-cyclic-nucleotide 2'-phosphodiesterase/5'-nucleotidase/3'-nucleotidase [Devosia sp. 63-57]VDS05671.1 Trifu
MKKLLLGATALTLCAGFSSAAYAEFTLNILHINDFHSRFGPITSSDSNCAPDNDAAGECFGGVARLKTAIDAKRAELDGQNVVLLDAGDQFQGSLFYTQYRSEIIAEFANDLGIEVMAVGNHEFDDGPEELAKLLDAVKFPIISGNTNVDNEPLLAGRIAGTHVLDFGGEKVGIVSALAEDTDETSSPGDNVEFEDTFTSLRAQVDALKAAGVNKIIALTHVGYAQDLQIAANVPGIDVVVGGHSHTLLSNTDEKALGPYPTMVNGPDGHEVPVVTAYSYGKYLGDLVVTWDDDGNVTTADGAPILLDASVAPYEAYVTRLAELEEPIQALMAEVIGVATAPIDGSRETCRAVECEMGNLVADAILDRVADQGVTIAFQNGGGLRASIDAGDITMGEVLTVLPFSNTLATVELSGADVIDALENGVSDVENGAGRFAQVAGLKYSYTLAKPAGERVSDVMVKGDGDSWVPIDEEGTYKIVTNNYTRGGGDGYGTFAEGTNPYDFGPPLEQVLADYIAKQGGEYTPYTDGRITVIK